MFLARFSANLQRQIDLTNAFKSFFRDDSFEPCRKTAGNLAWGACGASMREAKGRKAWNLPPTLSEPFLKATSKSVAQG